ncbi:MAG: NADH:ubiquinone reductase (Na(+)-transporting) subunit C [Bacteroidaceae bacterium]|nr:NADH:ubiquinone reductase (Na(+)-transporting) subunit C [Bacteroidaceae bacterium]
MNTNKNTYTFIYASIVVIIVAFLLAFVSSALHQRQQDNIALDKKKHILASLNIFEKDAASAFDKYITAEQLLNADGTVASSEKGCAFECGTADIVTKHPLYVASVDGDTKYVFPLTGQGLWGPISGYIALNSDKNTVYGVDFSHEGETPGLGAEITNRAKFQTPFRGKTVMKDGKVALSVVKNGKVENPAFEVDGLSGATFTSVGVSKMLQSILTSYSSFLSKSPAQPERQPEASVAESNEAESNN